MRVARLALSVSLAFFLSLSIAAQQTATSSPQALLLLQRSAAALSGGQAVTDVSLTGIARRIAGSDDESGTAVLKALVTGESSVDFSFPSGPRGEVRANSPTGPVGSWLAPDGTSQAISQHNLWTDSSWFFPPSTLTRLLSDSSYGIIAYVAHETKENQAVEHLTAVRQFQATGAPASWTPDTLQHLSAMDVYLDSFTLLPSAIRFNTHPDRNQTVDIPVEIRFADYREVSGVNIPFHIQKYFNNGLALDIHVTTATLNTGLTVAAFSVR